MGTQDEDSRLPDSESHAQRGKPRSGIHQGMRPHQHESQPGYPSYQVHGYPSYSTMHGMPFAQMDIFDFRELFRVLTIKKRLVFIVLAFALTSWFFYVTTATSIYQAESILELSLRRPRISGQQEAVIDDARLAGSSTADQINTQILKLQGQALRSRVLEKTKGTFALYGFEKRDASEFLEKGVDISLIRRTTMVKISVEFEDAKVAAFVANTYAAEAVQEVLDMNKASSKSAVQWLEFQVQTQRESLNEMEQRILEFKKANQLETLKAQRDAIRESLTTYSGNMTESIAERDRLLSLYTEQHPEVKTQDQLIAATLRQYENAVNTAQDLEKTIAEATTRLTSLEREKEALETAYKGLLKRIEEARMAADENTTTMKLAEVAEVPTVPVKPLKLVSLIIALLLGSAGAVALACIMHRVEDRIWHLDDIEETLGVKLIGSVPHVAGRKNRERLATLSRDDQFGQLAESFGMIRGLVDTCQDGKTYIISSPEPEEGKTVCSCNLAIASARSGKKTLLVDFDLRRPKLASIWQMSDPKSKLINMLTGKTDEAFPELPNSTDVDMLDVIVSRAAVHVSPAQIFGSRHVKAFLEWAATEYDRVILDTPPVCVASDAMVLGGVVDGAILVMRFNKTRKTMVRNAVRRLADTGANMIGGVVTDVDIKRLGFMYGRYGNMRYASYDTKRSHTDEPEAV